MIKLLCTKLDFLEALEASSQSRPRKSKADQMLSVYTVRGCQEVTVSQMFVTRHEEYEVQKMLTFVSCEKALYVPIYLSLFSRELNWYFTGCPTESYTRFYLPQK